MTLLEADTDGVYFAVPEGWDEAAERRVVSEVGALLPPLVRLEFEGRYAAMLSHEPKNYALLRYDGTLLLRGVAFHSIKFEAFGDAFLRRAIHCLLMDDIPGVREAYLTTAEAIAGRTLPTADVVTRARLTKTPQQYHAGRSGRREAHYEALLAGGRTTWRTGESIQLYRAAGGLALWQAGQPDRRDYDVAHYLRLLRETYAIRLARAFTPDDYATLFGAYNQLSLFAPPIETIRPCLTPLISADDPTVHAD